MVFHSYISLPEAISIWKCPEIGYPQIIHVQGIFLNTPSFLGVPIFSETSRGDAVHQEAVWHDSLKDLHTNNSGLGGLFYICTLW